nr:hypothetical protein MmNV_63 [Menippe mercenaria nudivirus]
MLNDTLLTYNEKITDTLNSLDIVKREVFNVQKLINMVFENFKSECSTAVVQFQKHAEHAIDEIEDETKVQNTHTQLKNQYANLLNKGHDRTDDETTTMNQIHDEIDTIDAKLKKIKSYKQSMMKYLDKDAKLQRIVKQSITTFAKVKTGLGEDMSTLLELYMNIRENLLKMRSKINSMGYKGDIEMHVVYKMVASIKAGIDKTNRFINDFNMYIDKINSLTNSLNDKFIIYYASRKKLIVLDFNDVVEQLREFLNTFNIDPLKEKIMDYFEKHQASQPVVEFVNIEVPDATFTTATTMLNTLRRGVMETSNLVANTYKPMQTPMYNYSTPLTETEYNSEELNEPIAMRYLQLLSFDTNSHITFNYNESIRNNEITVYGWDDETRAEIGDVDDENMDEDDDRNRYQVSKYVGHTVYLFKAKTDEVQDKFIIAGSVLHIYEYDKFDLYDVCSICYLLTQGSRPNDQRVLRTIIDKLNKKETTSKIKTQIAHEMISPIGELLAQERTDVRVQQGGRKRQRVD